MGSTFSGFEISKRGLQTHQRALEVTGHNVSNADNKNYARQRVVQSTMPPLYEPALNRAQTPGQIGQGVKIASLQRVRDSFFDDQIILSSSTQHYWQARETYLSQIENTFQEPGDNTLRTLLDNHWNAWQNLSQYPAEIGHREVVLETGQTLTDRIQDTFQKLSDLRMQANREVGFTIQQINNHAGEIRDLNERILKIITLGDNPNDLLDRRDALLEKLSELVNVRIGRSDRDELIVFIGEQALIQGEVQRFLQVQANPLNNGFSDVVWQHNQRQVVLNDGKLVAFLEIRDRDLVQSLNEVDTYAVNLADIVNEIHRDGFGLTKNGDLNFFDIKNRNGQSIHSGQFAANLADVDLDNDGVADHTAVFRISSLNSIGNEDDLEQPLGISGVITFQRPDQNSTVVNIAYQVNDSIRDVITRINDAQIGVTAHLDHANRLSLKATASDERNRNFMIRYLEDSGDLLVGRLGILQTSGVGGAFDYRTPAALTQLNANAESLALTPNQNPARMITLSAEVANNPANVASAYGRDRDGDGNPELANQSGDGGIALTIAAAIKENNQMVGFEKTFADFYAGVIADVGSRNRSARDNVQRYADTMVHLVSQRQTVMGVNLDEEISNMVQFQHSYNASARMLRAFDEMYNVIINGIGQS